MSKLPDIQPGEWSFDDDFNVIWIACPGADLMRGLVRIPVKTADHPYAGPDMAGCKCVWDWDGNKEAPTLTPSVNVVGIWHGWLRQGKLVIA